MGCIMYGMNIKVMCPCGNVFITNKWRIEQGRGRYCSRKCMYVYRKRPSGLSYKIVVKNRGWFIRNDPRSFSISGRALTRSSRDKIASKLRGRRLSKKNRV